MAPTTLYDSGSFTPHLLAQDFKTVVVAPEKMHEELQVIVLDLPTRIAVVRCLLEAIPNIQYLNRFFNYCLWFGFGGRSVYRFKVLLYDSGR